jgi:class 3 adenylate cyclase
VSWRIRLLLLATAVGVVFPFLLPPLHRLEWKSYDQRLAKVRETRGNQAPSLAIRMFGRDEQTLRKRPDWGPTAELEAVKSITSAGAARVWVDPKLGMPPTLGVTQVPPLKAPVELDGVVRKLDLAGDGHLAPSLELFAALQGVPAEKVVVTDFTVTVGERVLPRLLAVDFPKNELGTASTEDSSDAAYLEPNPLWLLADPDASKIITQKLSGTAVLISDNDVQARYVMATPVGPLQAHQLEFAALDTMLSGWVLQQPPLLVQLALTTLCILFIASTTFFVQTTSLLITVWLSLTLIYHLLCARAFAAGWWLPEVPVISGGLIAAVIVAVAQRGRAVRLLERLLGAERAQKAAGGEVRLGGSERPVTIVFTNLPEQIKALEKTDPEESIRARNRYNALITPVIRRHLGWVLDYQGDAQMAGFGVEQLDPAHALNAIRAGLELHALLTEQYPGESIHCGVCTGPAAVGLVGAPGAKALAAIGDTTNVAARLMGAAMKQKVGVLISKTAHDECAESLQVHQLPAVALKGKTSNVEVYAVEGAS